MSEPTHLLDPTSERTPAQRDRLTPPASLEGLTVALLDISKPRGDVFLDRIEERLTDKGLATKRYLKPTMTRKAPQAIIESIVDECEIGIEALAD